MKNFRMNLGGILETILGGIAGSNSKGIPGRNRSRVLGIFSGEIPWENPRWLPWKISGGCLGRSLGCFSEEIPWVFPENKTKRFQEAVSGGIFGSLS